jgi:hypothetical protein
MRDETPRLHKMADAVSQFINVATARDHAGTTANESVSGRAHRLRLRREKWIDRVFWWQRDPPHCEGSYLADLERARAFEAQHQERKADSA